MSSDTSISQDKFFRPIGTLGAPVLVDVRLNDFTADPCPVQSSHRRSHLDVDDWGRHLSGQPPEGPRLSISRIGAAYYSLHFLIARRLIATIERPRLLPYFDQQTGVMGLRRLRGRQV